jgi:hypothetical protein
MACRWEGVDHAGAIEPCRSGRPGLAEELAQQPERELCGSGPDERRRHQDGPVLFYTKAEIAAFIQGVKDGEFDDLIV